VTDQEIISGCKKHKAKYQKQLLEKYSGILMSTAMRYLKDESKALDALQETWIKVFNNIDKYEEEGKLQWWLKKVLINNILKTKTKIIQLTDYDSENNDKAWILPSVESKLNMEDLMKIVNTVPSPAKEVFIMNIIDGMNHKEIAEILSIKESTSRVHLTNARKYLRQLFTNSKEISI
jgi:RNA polymerase sigma-70 factor (ECF subfamily)